LQDSLKNHLIYPPSKFLKKFVSEDLKFPSFDMEAEMTRQKIPAEKWKLVDKNANYELSPAYPAKLYLPTQFKEEELIKRVANFRTKGRIPALTWYNSRKESAIIRAALPKPDVADDACKEDQNLVEECKNAGAPLAELVIFDSRPRLISEGNKTREANFEDVQIHYSNCRVEFNGMMNLQLIRTTFDKLDESLHAHSTNEANWLSLLQDSKWLSYIRVILAAALKIAYYVENGASVLIQEAEGSDCGSQLSALAQIMLDPFYRTFKGFQVLIEKDWFSFGHQFRDRVLNRALPDQRSPIFLQFLECVWNLQKQFPHEFEFSEAYLLALADNFDTGFFGEFLYNSEMERKKDEMSGTTISIWSLLDVEQKDFQNEFYKPKKTFLTPICSLRIIQFWFGYYHRHDFAFFRRFSPDLNIESSLETAPETNQVMWVPSDTVNDCVGCGKPFSVFSRKHHCRNCGQVFCSNCLNLKIKIPFYGTEQKVCKSCLAKNPNLGNEGLDE